MRKNFGSKPLSYPQPVLILATYNEDGSANAMNAAWGGISEENEISICLSVNHKTCENFKRTGALTISMADADHVKECDYFGISTGNKTENKVSKAGMSVSRSEFVDAPIINELGVCLECRVKEFNEETCILKAEIVNVSVDEKYLTDGKVDINKVRPICFDPFNGTYNLVGEVVGKAFSDGKSLMK